MVLAKFVHFLSLSGVLGLVWLSLFDGDCAHPLRAGRLILLMEDLGRLLQRVDQIGVGLDHWEAVRLHSQYGLKRVVLVPHRIHRRKRVMSRRVNPLLRVPAALACSEVTTRLLL